MPNSSRSRRRTRWHFFLSMITLLLLLSSFSPAKAAESKEKPDGTSCFHCYGATSWLGGTFGARTVIYVHDLSISGTGYFVIEVLWLVDLTYPSGVWTEIGYYMGASGSYGVTSWVYSYLPPGGAYTEVTIGAVPAGDKQQWADIKITRNTQTPTTLLIAVVGHVTNWSTTINNSQGGSTWAGNRIDIGSELYWSGSTFPWQGPTDWIENRWQDNTGGGSSYHYQTTDGTITQNNLQHPVWYIHPANSTTGGHFIDDCCY